jgi:hypothetical protein
MVPRKHMDEHYDENHAPVCFPNFESYLFPDFHHIQNIFIVHGAAQFKILHKVNR